MRNNCKGSLGTFMVKGKNQDYPFCVHKIKVIDEHIDLSKGLDPTKPLNPYGTGPFCEFRILDHLDDIGLYCFIVDGELKYIGETDDSFGDRFNDKYMGYGNIHPRNCYKDGQSTNCRINFFVNEALRERREVLVGFFVMNDAREENIDALEKELIAVNDLVRLGWNRK